jgi:hypothetical protein
MTHSTPVEVSMLLLFAIPVIGLVAFVHGLVQSFAPSNVLIGQVRGSQPTLRSAVALFVLAALLGCLAHAVCAALRTGAPGWLNLLVLVLLWDAIKFALLAAHTTLRRMFAPTSRRFRRTALAGRRTRFHAPSGSTDGRDF